MKIILKAKPDELRALVELIEQLMYTECRNRHDAMVVLMMLKLYKKLKEKSILIDAPLRMSIPAEYAIAFIEFFSGHNIPCHTFAGNYLMKLMNHFDQQTAGLYY